MGWIFSSGAYIKHTSEGVLQSLLSAANAGLAYKLYCKPLLRFCDGFAQ